MKKIQYKVVVGDKGFKEMESRISELMNDGWKAIGGIAFNAGYPYQAIAKMIETTEEKPKNEAQKKEAPKMLGASAAMKRIDDLT